MIKTDGPYTAVAGTMIAIMVPADALWVYVNNDSALSLLVSFQDIQPTAVDALSGQYQFAVRPHSDPVIPIQREGVSAVERQLNGIADFHGYVWIYPRDPGGLASNGTISSRAEVFVTTGGPYDATPLPSSTERQTDVTSQPRVISVPVLAQAYTQSGAVVPTTGLPVVYQLANERRTVTIADAPSSVSMIGYLHGVQLSLDSAGVRLGFRIVLLCQKPGQTLAQALTNAETLAFYQGYVTEPQRVEWTPRAPRVASNTVIASVNGDYTVSLCMVFDYMSASAGVYWVADYTVYGEENLQLISTVPPIGDGNPLDVSTGNIF